MAKRVSKRKQEKVLSPTEMRRKLLIERKHRAESRAVFSVLIPVLVLLAGFLGSELLLFLQGAMFWGAMGFLPFYYEALFGVSTLMPVGVGVLVVRNRITV